MICMIQERHKHLKGKTNHTPHYYTPNSTTQNDAGTLPSTASSFAPAARTSSIAAA